MTNKNCDDCENCRMFKECFPDKWKDIFGDNKKLSVTTSKHINQWAGKDATPVEQSELDNLVK